MSDTDFLIDRIMAALEAMKPLARDMLQQALAATTPIPKPPEVTDFVKIGSHARASDGKMFNLYVLSSDPPHGPHIDKVELKPHEIAAVLTQWNAEAKATLKGSQP